MERINPLDLLGMMKRQHALSHAPCLLLQAISTITYNLHHPVKHLIRPVSDASLQLNYHPITSSFIQNDNFYYKVEDSETKMMKETSYEFLDDDQKKKLRKNNEAKMTLYNALPRKEYERVFMCKTAKEIQTILARIMLESFLDALPLKWIAKVTAIEKAKDLATLSLDEIIGNLKIYEMVLDNDGVASKTTKEKVKSLALKAKVTRDQTSDDSESQGGSVEDVDDEKEVKAFNILAKNFRKFFHKVNFVVDVLNMFYPRFGDGANRFGNGRGNSFGNKGGEISKTKGVCYNYGIDGHFANECRKPKENKAFIGGAWSDSEDGDGQLNDMIDDSGNPNATPPVPPSRRLKSEDNLSVTEKAQVEADRQASNHILLGIPNNIHATIDCCPNSFLKWKRVQRLKQGIEISQ
ncbi:retrovirus-related pol polyprotein from transposon TNT 1-94 [Tanacetum coccineum]|uniref:Retrovirus-related pol polyprotein from transposon TNT 1-94 n=1 Tax=Tanacetum coccineum TaxID=301880 RepID=A0ABQ4XD03_9ASTR